MSRPSGRPRARLAGIVVCTLLVTLLVAPPARPARAPFASIETRDLRLTYLGPTLGFIAPYTASCFENSLRFYRRTLDYRPTEPVNLFLDDQGDYGNAAVWGTPRSSMIVHIAPANNVYETTPGNERINFTLNHELAHVVTLDQATGRDLLFRRLFHGKVRETSDHPETILYGFLTLPRRTAPRWHREGTAVFFETWMAGGLGRAQGPYDEMVFRAMVRDSAHFYDPLGLESEGVRVDFQAGVNAYLYGTRFMTWMAYQESPAKLVEWVSRQPGSRAYFASQFAHVYGRPLNQAWQEWIDWEHGFQRANLDSVHRYPTTPYRDLAPYALGSVSRACLDTTNRTLYAGVNYPGTVPYLAAVPLDGGPIRNLGEVKGPALYFVCSVAFDPEARTLYYTADNNDFRDLCALDLRTGRSRVLARDARVGDLAWNRQDHSLWGVRHFNGISTLVRFTAPYRDYHSVFSFPYSSDLYDLDISPDGQRLAASVPEVSGRQTLRLYSAPGLLRGDTTSRRLYDFGSSIPNGFVFSPDGRFLYGSSYYTGVSNIFRYDLVADSMDVVTNAETGFFRPVPLGGDSLVVFRFTGRGFVPARVDARPLTDVSAITFLGARLVEKYPELETWRVPSPRTVNLDSLTTYAGPYRPLRRFGPATVYPVVEGYKSATAVGLQLDLSDPFSFYNADLTVTHTPEPGLAADERWHVTAGYHHQRVTARLRYNVASFYDLFGPTKTSRKGWGLTLDYDRTLIRDDPRTLDLSLGAAGYAGLERLPEYQNVATSPGFNKLVSWSGSLAYKNLRSSIGAVDPEKGRQGRLEGTLQMVRFERLGHAAWRGFPLLDGTFDAGLPLPLGHASVWLRNAAGWSPGSPDEPFANFYFGGFGNNWVDHQDAKRYRQIESFPGLGLNAAGGVNFARTMVDLNLPPLRFRHAGWLDLYAAWARASLFSSALVTDVDHGDLRRRIGNVGAQVDVRLALMIQQPLTFSVGWARAFERRVGSLDEWMVSLKIL
jgi:hypothetical protein